MFVRLTSVKFINNKKTSSSVLINTEQVRYIEQFNRGGIDDYYWIFFGDGTGSGESVIVDESSFQKLIKYLEIV